MLAVGIWRPPVVEYGDDRRVDAGGMTDVASFGGRLIVDHVYLGRTYHRTEVIKEHLSLGPESLHTTCLLRDVQTPTKTAMGYDV